MDDFLLKIYQFCVISWWLVVFSLVLRLSWHLYICFICPVFCFWFFHFFLILWARFHIFGILRLTINSLLIIFVLLSWILNNHRSYFGLLFVFLYILLASSNLGKFTKATSYRLLARLGTCRYDSNSFNIQLPRQRIELSFVPWTSVPVLQLSASIHWVRIYEDLRFFRNVKRFATVITYSCWNYHNYVGCFDLRNWTYHFICPHASYYWKFRFID